MFASGFPYDFRHGLELSIIAVSSQPRLQVSDVERDRHRCGYSIDGRRLWVDLCRSYTQLVLVKSDANDWSGRMQICEQISATTQQPKHGSSAEFMGPLADDSHWGNSNPDLFTDYRGFRIWLGIRLVVTETPYPSASSH